MVRSAVSVYTLCFMVFVFSGYSDETFNKLYNAGKYKEAIEYADQKISPPSRSADIWVKIAHANEKLGFVEKALASYMVSWRLNPKDYASLLGAARIYNNLRQFDNGLNMAKKALEQKFTGEASWEYAKACIALKRPKEAKKALEKVIETDPTNSVANRELGIIYYKDKQYRQAIPLLKKSFEKKADGNVAFQIGRSYLNTGDANAAIDYLIKARKMKKSLEKEIGLELARVYYEKGNYAQAASEYSAVDQKVPFSTKDYFQLAMALEKLNKKKEAIDAYNKAIAKYGSSKQKEAIVARQKVGTYYLDVKKYKDALTHFSFIVSADPKGLMVRDIYFLLADTHLGMKNSTKAIQNLEKAIAIDKKNVEAYARLADLYTKSNQTTKAKATYEKMMSLSPNDPHVYFVLGEYNLKSKNYSKALELFVKSNSLKKSAKTLEGIALSAAALNQWDKARDAAESAVSMDDSLLKSRRILANALMKIKSYKEAKNHLAVLVKHDPANLSLWNDLAKCYASLNETANLAEVDKRVIALDSKNTTSRLRHAKYSLGKGEQETAYLLYKELSLLLPKNPSVFQNLFEIATKKKEKENAIAYLKKYLALNPNNAEYHKTLGDLLYDKKDLNGALSAYRNAIKVDPGIKGFYKRYAEIVIAKGKQNEVIKALTGVIKQGEADFGTYTTLGMIYMKKKDYNQAMGMYQKALIIDPQNTDALAALGDCQAQTGKLSAAVITYEQAIMLNPKADKEYRSLGYLYDKQGKTEQAMKAFRKYLDKVSTDQSIAIKLGNYLYDKKDYEGAAKYLSIVKGKPARDFLHQLKLCESNYYAKNYKQTIVYAEGLLKRSPRTETKMRILKMKAESLEKTHQEAKALLAYDEYCKIKGVRDNEIAFKRAFLRETTNPSLAERIYVENIRLYPTDSRNYLQLGLIYSKKKSTLSKAAPMLEKAAQTAGKDKSLWLRIAGIYGKLGDKQKELDAYKKYISVDPQNLEANIRIGTILMERDRVSEGMVYLETANTYSPNNIRILGTLAKGYLKTRRVKEAIELLEKAKNLKPDDIEIRRSLFKAYSQTGKKKQAIIEIKELLKVKRDNQLLMLYAELLLDDNKVKDAENAIEDIMATDPENLDALMLLAKIQRARKKYDEAIETYKEAIYIDANYAPALYERAETYMLLSKPQWAERFYERALRADPKFGLAELGKAKLAKSRKDKLGYISHLKKARQLDPGNPIIRDECRKAGI